MTKRPLLYPELGAVSDYLYFRVAGCGICNSFYTYFHSYRIAQQTGARMISPAWLSLRIGPLLRGEHGLKTYYGLFRAPTDELTGTAKLAALLTKAKGPRIAAEAPNPQLVNNAVHHVVSRTFTLAGLYDLREGIRQRLLQIMTESPPPNHRWGAGGYIAVHVRLGDFSSATNIADLLAGRVNSRIPIEWYKYALSLLSEKYPDMDIRIVSDGGEDELKELLIGRATIARTGSDLGDLMVLAGASILVGSHSTYSYWSAFLGNMSTVWLRMSGAFEKPTDSDVKIAYLGFRSSDTIDW